MTLYSHSRLQSFENCPRLFRYRYIDKIEVDEEGIEAFVGKRVHEILERLYHHVGRHGRPPSLSQVLERFRTDWQRGYHDRIRIVRSEFPTEYYFERGSRCLENYYRRHYPFDDGETVGIEERLELALDPSGQYRARGVVDRIVRRGDGQYEIHDYKTGGYLPPKSRFERDRQLALYQVGLQQTYDDAREVDLVWHYLSHNRTIRSRRTPEQLEALCGETIALIDRIEGERDFEPTPSALCRWCDYRGLCPAGDASAERDANADPSGDAEAPPGLGPVPLAAAAAAAQPAAARQLSLFG